MGGRSSKVFATPEDELTARRLRGPQRLPNCVMPCLLCCRCGPYAVFVPNPRIPGQGWDVIKDFERVGLTMFTVRKFFGLFRGIDTNGSGTISVDEFYGHFHGVQRSQFATRMFTIFDDDRSGEIDFREFTMVVWNVCTMSNSELARFGFRMVDNDGSNVIDTGEVRRLLATLTPSVDHASTAFEERVLQLMSRMDADGNGVVTCEEFVQFCVANPVMLKPVLDMQYSLRRATFGVRYWTAVMHKRYGKTTERDPMRRAIESAMAMTAKQRDAAVGELFSVMDHAGHRSLSTRRDMLNRWLPGSYGGAGNVVNKQAVIELAVKEVASHAVLVQGELDKQKHERELAVNRSNAGRRAPGKLRRLRDNIRNADDPGTSGTASGSAEDAGAADAVVGLGSRPGIGSSGSKGKGVSFDLRGNTTSLIRS